MRAARIKFRGPLQSLTDADRKALFDRAVVPDDMVRTTSEAIIDVVRRDGDAAIISLAR
jgi:histidinol dehydrogenase